MEPKVAGRAAVREERNRQRGGGGKGGGGERSTQRGGWRTAAEQGWNSGEGRARGRGGEDRLGRVLRAAAARARQFCSGHRWWIFAGAARRTLRERTKPHTRANGRQRGGRQRVGGEKGKGVRAQDGAREAGASHDPHRAPVTFRALCDLGCPRCDSERPRTTFRARDEAPEREKSEG